VKKILIVTEDNVIIPSIDKDGYIHLECMLQKYKAAYKSSIHIDVVLDEIAAKSKSRATIINFLANLEGLSFVENQLETEHGKTLKKRDEPVLNIQEIIDKNFTK
jgi:hypothetical protein